MVLGLYVHRGKETKREVSSRNGIYGHRNGCGYRDLILSSRNTNTLKGGGRENVQTDLKKHWARTA